MFSFYDYRKADPKYRKPKRFYVFLMVSEKHVADYKNTTQSNEFGQITEQIFSEYIQEIKRNSEPLEASYRIQIFKDLIYNAFKFAISKNFSDDKISCLLELTYHLLATSMKQILNFQKSFDLFKEYLLRHSLFRPPHSIKIYSLDEIKHIIDYFQATFFRNYSLYIKAFTPYIDHEISTFQMFKEDFPIPTSLNEGTLVNKDDYNVLDAYNKDKEIKLTKEELQEIMSGNSIHNIPEAKRQEIIRKHLEKQRKEKIDRVLQKELDKLNEKMIEAMKIQDEDFEQKFQSLTKKK